MRQSLDARDRQVDFHRATQPADPLVFLPLPVPLLALLYVDVDGNAVAQGVLELPQIKVAVLLHLLALALLNSIHEFAIVEGAVGPLHTTDALDFPVLELSSVGLVLFLEHVHTLSVEKAIFKVAFIVGAVGPLELAFTLLLALNKVALVESGSLIEALLTLPVLLVLLPLALVGAALDVLELALSLALSILEFSNVVLTIRVDLASISLNSSLSELAFVLRAGHKEVSSHSVF